MGATGRSVAQVELDRVRRAMQGPRPGLAAQLLMAPGYRSAEDFLPRHASRQGGVLVLLYPKAGRLHLILTRRSEAVASHKGQISLPGGAVEPQDASFLDTALREVHEEIGVEPAEVEVLGPLTPLYIPGSGFVIHPYVGVAARRPNFRPDPLEVAALIEVPLSCFLDPAVRQEEEWELHGTRVRVPFVRVGAHKIWGATAMTLSEFVAMVSRVETGGENAS